ncbi:hypothetical protein ACFWV1_19200 [Streptomyces sp. NPDC058700]|uniref:hypothetical protein n=1 Tax=Streptomyces sp. NPDC058700 TaxID=3346607 RepID=UPI00366705DB
MPTTRHHLNRQRRRQALAGPQAEPVVRTTGPRPAGTPVRETAVRETAPAQERGATAEDTAARPRHLVPLVILCVLTLLLGGFAGWAAGRAEELRDDPARGNTALTDLARTSEVKGQTAAAVAALFSYDHADPAPFHQAGKTLLTGKAVAQHRALLAGVLAQAGRQKTVITTTVTDSAVERIDGDRARVLVYADQSSVSTAGGQRTKAEDRGAYAGAMFAVDVVRRDGRWIVENLDTFGR